MSLIELMIGLAILGFLVMAGLPSMSQWLQNSQIRTAAETTLAGLQKTRAFAVQQNRPTRFTLVDAIKEGCVESDAGTSWVVSVDDPTAAGNCHVKPDEKGEGDPPRIVEVRSASEGTSNVVVAATGAGVPASVVVFNSLGRVVAGANIDTIDISNPKGGSCEHESDDGTMSCLRIQISYGGQDRKSVV